MNKIASRRLLILGYRKQEFSENCINKLNLSEINGEIFLPEMGHMGNANTIYKKYEENYRSRS